MDEKISLETKELKEKLDFWTTLAKEKDVQLKKMEEILLKAETNLQNQVLWINIFLKIMTL